MKDEILTYREMCDTERVQTLQRGMNYRLRPDHSVLLMSQRSNAPYDDRILEDGVSIIYEGHDVPRTGVGIDPKTKDQPYTTIGGKLTQNGLFVEAVKKYQQGDKPEAVHVYEKLFSGVWSFRGRFNLVDYEYVLSGGRKVFKFQLSLSTDTGIATDTGIKERTRIIPTEVKKEVWKRDGGRCVICGATDELHFDHDIPYSKGGSSITADNVRILCARHNLGKHDKIE